MAHSLLLLSAPHALEPEGDFALDSAFARAV